MKGKDGKLWLSIVLSICMIVSMMPTMAFAAGSDSSLDNDRYRIVALNGYNNNFNFKEVLIGEPADHDPYEKATPGFAYIGDEYNYVLRVDGVIATSGVTWSISGDTSAVNRTSRLTSSTLTFTCKRAGTITIKASVGGTIVREATITLTKDVASGGCGNHITWSLDKNRKLTLSGYGDMFEYEEGDVPWKHYATKITSVEIDNRITSISNYAFKNMNHVEQFTLPGGITRIGKDAFYGCILLKEFVIPDSVKSIGNRAFKNCYALRNIYIPESLNVLGSYTFENCRNMKNFNMPTELETIGDYAFNGCKKLREVQLNNKLKTIGTRAFRNCIELRSIAIPDSVTSLGSYAFYGCKKLENVVLSQNISLIRERTFWNCSSLSTITIPNSVKTIGASAFLNCLMLSSVELPDKLSSIRGGAFESCDALKTIRIPESVTFIGSRALGYIKMRGDDGYYYGYNHDFVIEGYTYSAAENYARQHNLAFVEADSAPVELSSCNIPDIPDQKYTGNAVTPAVRIYTVSGRELRSGFDYSLTYSNNVSVGKATVKITGNGTTCTGTLTKYFTITDKHDIAQGWTSVVADQSYTGSEIKPAITVYDNEGNTLNEDADYTISYENNINPTKSAKIIVSGIGDYCGEMIVEFTIMNPIVDSGYCGLKGKDNAEWVLSSEGILTISGMGAMENYEYDTAPWKPYSSEIKKVVIGEGITTVGAYCFNELNALKAVSIASTVEAIGQYAFSGCNSIKSVDIPSSVENIYNHAFSNCGIKTLTLHEGLKEIGYNAFSDCNNLQEVSIPNSVENIYHDAFRYCWNLSSAQFGDGLKGIGYEAFYGCNLQKLSLPDSVEVIGSGAFTDCRSLQEVELPSALTEISDDVFQWCSNLTSITIPNTVETIGGSAFRGCEKLKSVSFGTSLKSIGGGAFGNCSALVSVDLPQGVQEIRGSAFENCSSLRQVSLPVSLKAVGNNAFYNCESLSLVEVPTNTMLDYHAVGYIRHGLSGEDVTMDGFVIRGYENTDAELYAKDNNIVFEIICDHVYTPTDNHEPTCVDIGIREGYVCEKCGRLFIDEYNVKKEVIFEDLVIPPTGHDWDYANGEEIAGVITYHCKNINCTATTTDAPPAVQEEPSFNDNIEPTSALEAKGLDTVEKIQNELYADVTKQSGFESSTVRYMDISMRISLDGGDSFVDASAENIPAEGLRIMIPYNQIFGGIVMNEKQLEQYDFAVAHMISEGDNAGDVEILDCTKVDGGIEVTVHSLSPFAIAFKASPKYAISGKVDGYKGGEITVTVTSADKVAAGKTAVVESGSYSIRGLEAGNYDVAVSATGCVTNHYTISVTKDTTCDAVIYQLGDVDMNGAIEPADVTALARHLASIKTITDPYQLKLLDTNGSGAVSAEDVTHLAKYIAMIISSL